MRNLLFLAVLAFTFLLVTPLHAQDAPEKKLTKKEKKALKAIQEARDLLHVNELKTFEDSASYAVGINIGKNLQGQKMQINTDIMAQAIKDVYEEQDSVLSEQEVIAVLTKLQQLAQEAVEKENAMLREKNKAAGEAYLAENAKKEGVTVHESGLQYEIIEEGTGPQPSLENEVTVHYHGTLVDGTVFDSSVDRGEPISFRLGQLIRAWQIILPMMKEGAKYRIVSPSELAFGEQGPRMIGPDATLIFDIELIKIND